MGFGLRGARNFRFGFIALVRQAALWIFVCAFSVSSSFAADPAPAPAGQAASQGAAASSNSLAANLGKASAVLSMAAGGLYMAKGAQQLKCCSSGCPTSGSDAEKEKKKLEEDRAKKGKSVTCNFPKPLLIELLRPVKAEAGVSGCLDALISLTTGGLMMLTGMMQLKAANQNSQLADTSLNNMNGMGAVNPVSDTPRTIAGANLGAGGNSDMIKLDPALLRKGTANDIMNQFESKFGINRDQFARSVMGGEDPRKLLTNAPMNALSTDDVNKATSGAKAMSDSERRGALAGTQLSDAQKELAAKSGTGFGDPAYEVKSAGGAALSRLSFSNKKAEAELEAETPPAMAETMGLSPDLKAALEAKALDDRRNGITDLSIFEVIHNKYREKAKMIFGFDPDGIPKGVSRAEVN